MPAFDAPSPPEWMLMLNFGGVLFAGGIVLSAALGGSPRKGWRQHHGGTCPGLWWAVADVSTQHQQEWKQKYNGTNDLPEILYRRRWSNIGSCLFVVALYAIIALSNREPVTNILYLI